MHYPFLVADPRSGLQFRLSDTLLAELSLAPIAAEWPVGRIIAEAPDPVWAESLANAPVETISAVSTALEDLVMATPDLRVPVVDLPESRAKRHLLALTRLWAYLGKALAEGLAPLRHVLELPHGCFLAPLPVVEGSLDPQAPAAMQALYQRLKDEFGTVSAPTRGRSAKREAASMRCKAASRPLKSRQVLRIPAYVFTGYATLPPAPILPQPMRGR
ncbi:hypothetical protein RPE78_16295 (plasmid) [Thioclava litoralis]|uniref:Uncharacterized protein n=1 Tax=Thioclava litoralis TaxID=3076557 RepID=A0ABZ1E7F9_9RHOB|nr:hypothetical protein RPE78_16295 [Thioclava sp. FTW29]